MSIEQLNQALIRLASGAIIAPPSEDIFVGDGDYMAISAEFLGYFVQQGGLEPSGLVVDIGCGIGRMAAGLACYLDPEKGRYIGFDPVVEGIDWCKSNYGADFPHFSFEWVDFYNELYRPEGRILTTQYRFPIEDGSVDLAILTSVLTHLYFEEIAAYLKELARFTKPEGRIFATAYLFEGVAPERLPEVPHLDFSQADARHSFQYHVAGYPPLAAVAYREEDFAACFGAQTGRIPQIFKGRWRGGAGPWFQDLVLA